MQLCHCKENEIFCLFQIPFVILQWKSETVPELQWMFFVTVCELESFWLVSFNGFILQVPDWRWILPSDRKWAGNNTWAQGHSITSTITALGQKLSSFIHVLHVLKSWYSTLKGKCGKSYTYLGFHVDVEDLFLNCHLLIKCWLKFIVM